MPLVNLQTSVEVKPEDMQKLLAALTKIITEDIGTLEEYVMVNLTSGNIMMGGEVQDAALVEVKCVDGINRDVNNKLSEHISSLLHERLGIPSSSVYLLFTDVPAINWGWEGKICD